MDPKRPTKGRRSVGPKILMSPRGSLVPETSKKLSKDKKSVSPDTTKKPLEDHKPVAPETAKKSSKDNKYIIPETTKKSRKDKKPIDLESGKRPPKGKKFVAPETAKKPSEDPKSVALDITKNPAKDKKSVAPEDTKKSFKDKKPVDPETRKKPSKDKNFVAPETLETPFKDPKPISPEATKKPSKDKKSITPEDPKKSLEDQKAVAPETTKKPSKNKKSVAPETVETSIKDEKPLAPETTKKPSKYKKYNAPEATKKSSKHKKLVAPETTKKTSKYKKSVASKNPRISKEATINCGPETTEPSKMNETVINKSQNSVDPEVFVLPPNLLQKLGIHLENITAPEISSGPDSSAGVNTSKCIPDIPVQEITRPATKSSYETPTKRTSILETAILMRKSVFLSPTFFPTGSHIPGELEMSIGADYHSVGQLEQGVENDMKLTTEDKQPARIESLHEPLLSEVRTSVVVYPTDQTPANTIVESKVSFLPNAIGNEQPLIQSTIVHATQNNAPIVDDHGDEAYLSDCSNSNLSPLENAADSLKIPIACSQVSLQTNINKDSNNRARVTIISSERINPPQTINLNDDNISNLCGTIPVTVNTVISNTNIRSSYDRISEYSLPIQIARNSDKESNESLNIDAFNENDAAQQLMELADIAHMSTDIIEQQSRETVPLEYCYDTSIDEIQTCEMKTNSEKENEASNFEVGSDTSIDLENIEENEEILDNFVKHLDSNDSSDILESIGKMNERADQKIIPKYICDANYSNINEDSSYDKGAECISVSIDNEVPITEVRGNNTTPASNDNLSEHMSGDNRKSRNLELCRGPEEGDFYTNNRLSQTTPNRYSNKNQSKSLNTPKKSGIIAAKIKQDEVVRNEKLLSGLSHSKISENDDKIPPELKEVGYSNSKTVGNTPDELQKVEYKRNVKINKVEEEHPNIYQTNKNLAKTSTPRVYSRKSLIKRQKANIDLDVTNVNPVMGENYFSFCNCGDFGKLEFYNDNGNSQYEHIHFLKQRVTNCSLDDVLGIYNHDMVVVTNATDKTDIPEEVPDIYGICWNDIETLQSDDPTFDYDFERVQHNTYDMEVQEEKCEIQETVTKTAEIITGNVGDQYENNVVQESDQELVEIVDCETRNTQQDEDALSVFMIVENEVVTGDNPPIQPHCDVTEQIKPHIYSPEPIIQQINSPEPINPQSDNLEHIKPMCDNSVLSNPQFNYSEPTKPLCDNPEPKKRRFDDSVPIKAQCDNMISMNTNCNKSESIKPGNPQHIVGKKNLAQEDIAITQDLTEKIISTEDQATKKSSSDSSTKKLKKRKATPPKITTSSDTDGGKDSSKKTPKRSTRISRRESSKECSSDQDTPLSAIKLNKRRLSPVDDESKPSKRRSSIVTDKEEVTCGVCKQRIEEAQWIVHIAKEHEYLAWMDGEQPLDTNDEDIVVQHLDNVAEKFGTLTCSKCGFKRKSGKAFLQHTRKCGKNKSVTKHVKADPKTLKTLVKCGVCQESVQPNYWINHIQRYHEYMAWKDGETLNLDDEQEVYDHLYAIVKEVGQLVCPKCGIIRIYVKKYLDHVRTCQEECKNNWTSGAYNQDVYTCGVCSKQVDQKHWQDHRMNTHYNIAWIDGEMPVNIRNPYAIERLLKEYHKKKHTFSCNICGITRASCMGFYAHILVCGKTEQEVEELKILCPVCDKKYLCIYHVQHTTWHRNMENNKERSLVMEEKRKEKEKKELEDEASLIQGKRRAAQKAIAVIENYKTENQKYKHICKICNFGTDLKEEFNQHLAKCVKAETDFDDDDDDDKQYDAESSSSSDDISEGDSESDVSSEGDASADPDVATTPKRAKKKKSHYERDEELAVRYPRKIKDPKKFLLKSGEEFCAFHLSGENLFPEWRTCDYETIPEDDVSKYMNLVETSCRVKLNDEWLTFSKLEAKRGKGLSLFVGSSIQTVAWAPPASGTSANYLAIACHRDMECPKLETDQTPSYPGVIQIWDFGIFTDVPKFVLGLAHDYGTVWAIDWCPSGAQDSVDEAMKTDRELRMGLLAIACSNGLAFVYCVPYPSTMQQKIVKLKPVVELRLSMGSSRKVSQATSLRWSPQKGHTMIVVGYGDGTTAYYDLNTDSPMLKWRENDLTVICPYHDEQAIPSCVLAVDVYPSMSCASEAGAVCAGGVSGAVLTRRPTRGPRLTTRLACHQAVFEPLWPSVLLTSDIAIGRSALTEVEWSRGRCAGAVDTAAGCARCGRAALYSPPTVRLLRPHPIALGSGRKTLAILQTVDLPNRKKHDDLATVIEPKTYEETTRVYGLEFKQKKNLSGNPSPLHGSLWTRRYTLSSVPSMAFCPAAAHHERVAIATVAGLVFVVDVS